MLPVKRPSIKPFLFVFLPFLKPIIKNIKMLIINKIIVLIELFKPNRLKKPNINDIHISSKRNIPIILEYFKNVFIIIT